MSHDLHLRCISHEPHIDSGEIARYLSKLPEVRQAIRDRESIVRSLAKLIEVSDLYPEGVNALHWFLYYHPKCNLAIYDEYGEEYSLEDESEDPIPKCKHCGERIEWQHNLWYHIDTMNFLCVKFRAEPKK